MNNNFVQKYCPFCPSEEGMIVLKRKKFSARMCQNCRVIWCDPLRYDAEFHRSDEQAYLKVSKAGMKLNEKKLDLLFSFAASSQSHPKLLEIGCMHGLFLLQAREKGYNVHGLDLSASAVKLAEEILPGSVKVGTLDGSVDKCAFDIICAFNVIEHMESPHIFIRETKRVLAKEGYLMIETPSQESLYHHIMFFMARIFPDSNNEIGINPGGHIYKFGRKSWNNILSNNGYKVVMIKSVSTPIIELLAKKAKLRNFVTLIGLVTFGVLARLTGMGNRVVIIAKKEKEIAPVV